MSMSMPAPTSRKRVRFSEEVQETVLKPVAERDSMPRTTLLPQPDAPVGRSKLSTEEGPIKSTDPGLAAAVRAQHRKEIDSLKAGEALDVSLLDNVAAAEEYDDDEPELRFTEDGIPIEPFNLLSEKGEGYFDEDGNFLFYRQETEDAWVDSLPAGPIDGSQQQDIPKRASRPADDNVEQRPEMTALDRRSYKQRIVGRLRPGESVLAALKRLGTSELPQGSQQPEEARPKAERLAALRSRLAGTVPQENKAAFNALTEDAGQLLNAGDTGVYTRTREELLSGTNRHQAAASGRAVGATVTERAGDSREASAAVQLIARLAAPADDRMDVDEDSVAAPAPADPEADIFAAAPEAASVPEPTPIVKRTAAAPEAASAPESTPNVMRTGAAALPREATAREVGQFESMGDISHPSSALQQETQVPAATPSQGSEAEAATAGTSARSGAAENGTTSGREQLQAEPPMDREGFVFDTSTGMWYNTAMGCFFDQKRQLYGDAASGRWYAYQDGKYQLVA